MTESKTVNVLTDETRFNIPGCEVCGEPSYECTTDWIYHLDSEGLIERGEPRGEPHWRCKRHARHNRDLVMGLDGQLHRYEPSIAEDMARVDFEFRTDPPEVIRARATPHTEEDKAFDRKWWPEFCYRWDHD